MYHAYRIEGTARLNRLGPQKNSLREFKTSLLRASESASELASPLQEPRGGRLSVQEEDEQFITENFSLSNQLQQKNALLCDELRGNLILAPLTRGNHLPFRKLCVQLGAKVTMSEMAFAKQLNSGSRVERARLYRADEEGCYGFQVATKAAAEGLESARLAKESGARFIDLNCGCPIYEASRRGLGAVLLKKPRQLAQLVHGIAKESELPLTVKIRLGESEKKINVSRVVRLLSAAGAAAITIHGRTMEQRYKKPADWGLISNVTAQASASAPIIGNGDILTFFEASRRIKESGCLAVMVGRGALIKPWIFKEFSEGKEWLPTAEERISIYRSLYSMMRSHFGDDDLGKHKASYFGPWHHNFFHRYRHQPQSLYEEMSTQHPLIQSRSDLFDPNLGENSLQDVPRLERLLRCGAEPCTNAMFDSLWESGSDQDALSALSRLASSSQLEEWENDARGGDRNSRDESSEGRG